MNKLPKGVDQLPSGKYKKTYIPPMTLKSVSSFRASITLRTLKKYRVPLYLAALGLRRSEIGALTLSDLSQAKTLDSKPFKA